MAEVTRKFEELYNLHRNDLYSFIIRSVREENLALDLLHDVYLNFFQMFRSKEMPDDTRCRMYLFRIARNLIINHSRRSYTRRVNNLTSAGLPEEAIRSSEKTSLEDSVVNRLQMEHAESLLDELLSDLEPDEKMALHLRYTQDMRLEEISRVLDVSISGASRIIQKAARKLVEAGKKRGVQL